MDQATLADRLKRARLAAGLKQTEVAERLGVDRTVVSKIESGERKVDSLELRNMALLYDVSVEDLLMPKSADQGRTEGASFLQALRQYLDSPHSSRQDIRRIERFCENYRFLKKLEERNGLDESLPTRH